MYQLTIPPLFTPRTTNWNMEHCRNSSPSPHIGSARSPNEYLFVSWADHGTPTPSEIDISITEVSDPTGVPWSARTYVSGACFVPTCQNSTRLRNAPPASTDVRPPHATCTNLPRNQQFTNRGRHFWGSALAITKLVWISTVPGVPAIAGPARTYSLLPQISMTDSTTKEKTFPVWSDTLAGPVEVSIYRNVIKGAKLPQYKISRKKWYEKQGEIKSNYTLSREDWSIAMALERDAWRDIARMARSERGCTTHR